MAENFNFEEKQKIQFYTNEQLEKIKTKFPQLTILPSFLTNLTMSKLRNKDTPTAQFRHYADRVMRLLIETALNMQKTEVIKRETPCSYYDSVEMIEPEDFVAVTIMRAGNSFLHELLKIVPDIDVGQILLQRDEGSREKKPILYYTKLPKRIEDRKILLFDPMLATGGSVLKAIEEMMKKGVKQQDITFVNLIACEDGLNNLFTAYPQVQVVTAAVDPVLIAESKYIAPGLGDFGDRYFGTN